MQPLRDYQERSVEQVRAHWARGVRRVLLVSPTGSGKTRMGEELATPFGRVVWFAHRKELIADAARRLLEALGPLEVGIIAPGTVGSPHSRVQVATVQTALARGVRPPADLVVIDEAHHIVADDWNKVLDAYPDALILLLTATPERQDGRGLDGVADVMVVAADYSELLAAGHLCEVRVFRAPQILNNALAMNPVDAWVKHSGGSPGFAFFGSVKAAYENEHALNERGIRSAVVEQSTAAADRKRYIAQLGNGELDCICNVYTMTEGVDVPAARVCMLAVKCNHCGGYLQRVGRVLRPHASKPNAILIDLCGSSILHGMPTENRIYSLDGDPIRRTDIVPTRQCLNCGAVVHASYRDCPECLKPFPVDTQTRKGPKIYSLDLEEVYAGKDTPVDAKRAEYARLRKLQRINGYDLYYVRKAYKELFLEDTIIHDATNEEKRGFLTKLRAIQKAKGWKPGAVFVQFKQMFGHAPPW